MGQCGSVQNHPDDDDLKRISDNWLACCRERKDGRPAYDFFTRQLEVLLATLQPGIPKRVHHIVDIVRKYISIMLHRIETHDAHRDISKLAKDLRNHKFDPDWFDILGLCIIGAVRVSMTPDGVMSEDDDHAWTKTWRYIRALSLVEFGIKS